MSIPRLHPFEKTSIQSRHTIKRLEAFIDTTKDEYEKKVAENLLEAFKKVRKLIPSHAQDVDLKEKE